jgi:hypothetical protein
MYEAKSQTVLLSIHYTGIDTGNNGSQIPKRVAKKYIKQNLKLRYFQYIIQVPISIESTDSNH